MLAFEDADFRLQKTRVKDENARSNRNRIDATCERQLAHTHLISRYGRFRHQIEGFLVSSEPERIAARHAPTNDGLLARHYNIRRAGRTLRITRTAGQKDSDNRDEW